MNLSELKTGFEMSTEMQWDDTTETTYTNVSVNMLSIIAIVVFAETGQWIEMPVLQN